MSRRHGRVGAFYGLGRCCSCRWNQATETVPDADGKLWQCCPSCKPDLLAERARILEERRRAHESKARESRGQMRMDGVEASGLPDPVEQGRLF